MLLQTSQEKFQNLPDNVKKNHLTTHISTLQPISMSM